MAWLIYWPVAVNYGQRAAALLQRLEGRELHHVPNHPLVDVPWDAFGKAEFWQSGYADALDVLAHAQCKLKARGEAEDCAARHLGGCTERSLRALNHARSHIGSIWAVPCARLAARRACPDDLALDRCTAPTGCLPTRALAHTRW